MSQTTTRRVLLARFFHETHTMMGSFTDASKFVFRQGRELLDSEGDASPLGGMLEFAKQHGWEILPTAEAYAFPSGTIKHDVFERFWDAFYDKAIGPLESKTIDAIYLVLHGASVTDECEDVDGEFLSRIRQLPNCQDLPIYGVYDLHANVSAKMVDRSDALVAYRENPHVDAREAAIRACELLERFFQTGIRPRHMFRQTPLLWPPTGTGTASDPMKRLLKEARDIEASDPSIIVVNVNGGFGYSDVFDAGVSFSIAHESTDEKVNGYLNHLARLAMDLAPMGLGQDESPVAVMSRLAQETVSGLTVLVEPSDNIGAGSPGDGTALLQHALSANLPNLLACIADAEFVRDFSSLELGSTKDASLGAKLNRLSGHPIEGVFSLRKVITDGRFELFDKKSHLASAVGDSFDMGPCVVVQYGNATILVTSIKTAPMDLGQYHHVGIDPSLYSYVIVKAAVAHRAAYDPIAARQIWVDTPGPCSSNLRQFPFTKIRRPVFPLDDLDQVTTHGPPLSG
jgi:microcystin degradation protein MlrC